jgi:DNA-binding GntR family transcriptional regulator
LAEVKEIYEILGILESAAVGLVASQITAEEIKLLKRYNQKMCVAVQKGDFEACGAWNWNFHDVFLSKLANQMLCAVYDTVRASLFTFPVRPHALRGYLQKSVCEHREIIRLALAKDAQRLRRYFKLVHWRYEKDRPYIEAAFDQKGQAAVFF